MVNKVTLIGNLGRDPEVRRLDNGAAVAKFSVATSENYKDNMGNWQEKTEWHNVVAWRNLAEKAENGLKKGSMVYVEGRLSTRKWTDQNNIERRTTDVVANYFRIIPRREGNSGYFPTAEDEPAYTGREDDSNIGATTNVSMTSSSPVASQPMVNEVPTTVQSTANTTNLNGEDDDLPF